MVVEQELAADIKSAKNLIAEKKIWVDGFPADNPATLVDSGAHVELRSVEQEWASRASEKIWKFIEAGWIDPKDKVCLDVGASTGGFTDALLRAGAGKVYAVDVGYGQLLYRLRNNSRVTVLDRYNFRYAKSEDFQPPPEIFSMDVSFISSLKLIDSLNKVMAARAGGLLLVKPQFEAPKKDLRDGIVTDARRRRKIVDRVLSGWQKKGWSCQDIAPAPLKGSTGNTEYIAHLTRI